MGMKWTLCALAWLSVFSTAQVRAADVAVMPVQGVNLPEGACDAIGMLFANAFARDAHVVVASPVETKALRGEAKSAAEIAMQLGAARYVELNAIQLGQKVKLGGTIYARGSSQPFQAETTAQDLDAMDRAIKALAHALAWRRPLRVVLFAHEALDATEPQAASEAVPEVPEPPLPPTDPNAPRGAYGPKLGLAIPRSAGKAFSPGISIQFDARFGPPAYFLEFGAGILFPTDDQSTSTTIRVTSGFLEIGASSYLWAGNTALYLGAGLMPSFWATKVGLDDHASATCAVFGQLGLTFTRNQRFKVYGEFRLSQLLLGVSHPLTDGNGYATTLSDPYRPMVLAFQAGVGF